MKTIICPVGASLFLNYRHEEVRRALVDKGYTYEDLSKKMRQWDQQPSSEFENVSKKQFFLQVSDLLEKHWLKDIVRQQYQGKWEVKKTPLNENASAEIQSLIAIIKHYRLQDEDYRVHLVCPESVLSRWAAELIQRHFESDAVKRYLKSASLYKDYSASVEVVFNPQSDVIKQLNIHNVESFISEGVEHLMARIRDIAHSNASTDLLLNITGGYKVLTPFLMLMRDLGRIDLCYTFESSEKVIFPTELYERLENKWRPE